MKPILKPESKRNYIEKLEHMLKIIFMIISGFLFMLSVFAEFKGGSIINFILMLFALIFVFVGDFLNKKQIEGGILK